MSYRTLRPIVHKDSYTDVVEAQLLDYLRETIFGPLLELLHEAGVPTRASDQAIGRTPEAVMNARQSPVVEALKSRQIAYVDGRFTGRFNVAISRELRGLGAQFNPGAGAFEIPLGSLSMDIRSAVSQVNLATDELYRQMAKILAQMEGTISIAPTGISMGPAVDKITSDLQKQFESTTGALDAISIPAEVSPGMRANISASLTENLSLDIKNFAAQEIPELRTMVERSAFAGGRAKDLSRLIEARYGVSKRKARFLAENETSLIVSKYREERYKEIGSNSYKWATSHDSLVRHDHAVLNGRTFSWDSPPIVDQSTGRRCNPGEDYNCRCVAMPIVPIQTGVYA